MDRTLTQRLLAILCLVAFGLGKIVFASFGVVCTDAAGKTRIEFACIKSNEGACVTSCSDPAASVGDEHSGPEPDGPAPCEDEPLGSHLSAARVVPSSHALESYFATVVVVMVWDRWSDTIDQPVGVENLDLDRDRPPDSLVRLRSVILVM